MQHRLARPRLGRLRLRHLQLLELLLAHGTLHAAAREMHVTVPAVSLMVRDLEDLVGMELFQRTRRGLVPTDAARAIAPRCRTLLNELESLDADIETARAQRPRDLRIGVLSTVLYVFMPAVLGSLTRTERWSIVFRDGQPAELLRGVLDGELDCAVMRLPREGLPGDDLRRIALINLYEEPWCFVSRPKHPLVARAKVDFETLQQTGWALPPPGSFSTSALNESFVAKGLPPPHPVVQCRHFIYNLRIVAQSDLLTIAPASIAREYEKLGLVRVLRVGPLVQPPPVSFVYRSALADDPVVARVGAVLRQVSQAWRSRPSSQRDNAGSRKASRPARRAGS